jgi:hypothetical protein
MKIRKLKAVLLHSDRQTDRQYDAMAAGRNSFTKAPKIMRQKALDAS